MGFYTWMLYFEDTLNGRDWDLDRCYLIFIYSWFVCTFT